MNSQLLLVIVIALSALTLIGLLILAHIVNRLHGESERKHADEVSRLEKSQQQLIEAIRLPVESVQSLENVFTELSFGESLAPDRFAAISRECAIRSANRMLLSSAADGVVLTINAIALRRSCVEMVVAASKNGQKLLQDGTAVMVFDRAGRALPILKDAQSGKFMETMRESKWSGSLSKLGAMTAVVVGAAHMVASADIADRLKQVESKLDLLLAYRKIDQMAKLERIFTSAKELSSGPMNGDKRLELWRLRGELREPRFGWRREMEDHLHRIEDPKEADWLSRQFTSRESADRSIKQKITEAELKLMLIDYSLRLDLVLAVGSDSINGFENTLAGETSEWQRLADLLKEKAALLSNRDPELSVDPTIKGMNALIEQYAAILPEATATEAPRPQLSPPDAETGPR